MSIDLDPNDPAPLETYLRAAGPALGDARLAADERIVRLEKPGEGNMNCTLRVHVESEGGETRTFIVKQARPWVEKYPTIAAPVERAAVEAAFYENVSADERVRGAMPRLLGHAPESHLLALEDLGASSDLTSIYARGRSLAPEVLDALVDYLSALHVRFDRASVSPEIAERLSNRAMRALNAEHIFDFPFREENSFDLDAIEPGLQALSLRYKHDRELKERIAGFRRRYLADGEHLLHGDFYPGSWIASAEGPRVIDPEFGFFGPAEFDVGVLLAHLALAQMPRSASRRALERYRAPTGFDARLARGYAGIEILRRILGVAQLPLALDFEETLELLEAAREWVL